MSLVILCQIDAALLDDSDSDVVLKTNTITENGMFSSKFNMLYYHMNRTPGYCNGGRRNWGHGD